MQIDISVGLPAHNLESTLSATGSVLYTVPDVGNDDFSLATKDWESDGEVFENATGTDSVPGILPKREETDEEDEGEGKKSVGSQIGDGAGLRLSFAVFVIWAFFC